MSRNKPLPFTPREDNHSENRIEQDHPCGTLQPHEMYAMSRLLAIDYRNPGEYIFALLAWITGARASELLELRWKDIVPLDETASLYGLRIAQPGHTPDFRIIPLPANLYRFLKLRYEECLTRALPADQSSQQAKDQKYICCTAFLPTKQGSEQAAIKTLTEVLRAVGVPRNTLEQADDLISRSSEPGIRDAVYGPIFFLRPSFAVCGITLGLTVDEIRYLLGLPMETTSCSLEAIHSLEGWTRIQAKLDRHPFLQDEPKLFTPTGK